MTVRGAEWTGDIKINPSIINQVSLYPNYLDCIREYVANAWDADADRVEITITDKEMIWEDWGLGISDISQFWEIASPMKQSIELTPKFHRKPIGAKGIGKLAFMMLGRKVDVETRTWNKAYYSDADFKTMRYFCKQREKPHEVLNHLGTRIKISQLKREIQKDDIIQYCKANLYGLMLPIASENVVKIFVNEIKVKPKTIQGGKGQISTPFGDIDCVLTPSKTSSIDVLYRGVKVKEINPAPTHPAKGYFNVDWLTPTADRHDFADTEEYRVFYDAIKRYIIKNIPTKTHERPEELRQTLRQLAKFVKEILHEMGMLPEATMPMSSEIVSEFLGKGEELRVMGEEQQLEHKEPKEQREPQIKLHSKILGGKKNTPLRTDYGINYYLDNAGEDRPPVISYKEDKYIIINLDNELVQNLIQLSPSQRLVGLAPLIARGIFHILERFNEVKEYEAFLDQFVTRQYSKMLRER